MTAKSTTITPTTMAEHLADPAVIASATAVVVAVATIPTQQQNENYKRIFDSNFDTGNTDDTIRHLIGTSNMNALIRIADEKSIPDVQYRGAMCVSHMKTEHARILHGALNVRMTDKDVTLARRVANVHMYKLLDDTLAVMTFMSTPSTRKSYYTGWTVTDKTQGTMIIPQSSHYLKMDVDPGVFFNQRLIVAMIRAHLAKYFPKGHYYVGYGANRRDSDTYDVQITDYVQGRRRR